MSVAPCPLAHFAINADDPDRSMAFYRNVFGWTFTPWGPPGTKDFYRIDMGEQPVQILTVLQKRRELVPGVATHGFEPTIAVTSLTETEAAIKANGGRIVMERSPIPGVGDVLFFADPSELYVGAIEFVKG